MKKLNTLCAISLIISIIIGLINPYEQYISFIINFWYIFSMFIYFINVKVTISASKINGLNKAVDNYIYDYSNVIEGKGIKIFMVAALCLLKIFFLVVEIWLYSRKTIFGIKLLESAILIDNALLILVFATIAETIVVLSFSIRIWNEKREGVE